MSKQKRMIKTILLVILLAVLLFVVYVAVQCYPVLRYAYEVLWENSAEFDAYETEFCLIKDYALTLSTDAERVLLYNRKNITFTDCKTLEKLMPPDDIKTAVETIDHNAFPCKYATFDTIRIYDGCVCFVIESGQYALIYSPDKKPTGIAQKEDSGFIAKKIRDGWYHVVHDPNS